MPEESKFEKICVSVLKLQVSELEKKVENGEYASFSDVSRAAYREFLERHPNVSGPVNA